MIDTYEVVKKLIGPINPVAETHIDTIRLENLKEMTELVDALLADVWMVAMDKNSHYGSVADAAKLASDFLTKIGLAECAL